MGCVDSGFEPLRRVDAARRWVPLLVALYALTVLSLAPARAAAAGQPAVRLGAEPSPTRSDAAGGVVTVGRQELEKTVALSGEWELYPGQLLTPGAFQ